MTDRPDFTVCRQTDACLCPACYDRKHGEPPAEVAELADRIAIAEAAEAPAAEVDAEGAVCSQCGYPVVQTAAGWRHAQMGDAVACELFYQPKAGG